MENCKIYKVKTGSKILISIISFILSALSIFYIILPFLLKSDVIFLYIFFYSFSFAFIVLIIFVLIETFTYKLFLYNDKISVYKYFKLKEIYFSDIKGIRNGTGTFIVESKKNKETINIFYNIKNIKEIINLLTEKKIINLDLLDKKIESDSIVKNITISNDSDKNIK
jgi:hypothetical protein